MTSKTIIECRHQQCLSSINPLQASARMPSHLFSAHYIFLFIHQYYLFLNEKFVFSSPTVVLCCVHGMLCITVDCVALVHATTTEPRNRRQKRPKYRDEKIFNSFYDAFVCFDVPFSSSVAHTLHVDIHTRFGHNKRDMSSLLCITIQQSSSFFACCCASRKASRRDYTRNTKYIYDVHFARDQQSNDVNARRTILWQHTYVRALFMLLNCGWDGFLNV